MPRSISTTKPPYILRDSVYFLDQLKALIDLIIREARSIFLLVLSKFSRNGLTVCLPNTLPEIKRCLPAYTASALQLYTSSIIAALKR